MLHHFLVQVLALVLDVGVALHLLVFLLDLVLGHHQALAVLVPLPGEVGQRDGAIGQANVNQHGLHERGHHLAQPGQSRLRNAGHDRQRVADQQRQQRGEEGDLDGRLQELHEVLLGEDVLEVGQYVELLGRGLELLEREQHPHLQGIGEDPRAQHDADEGQHDPRGLLEQLLDQRVRRLVEAQPQQRAGQQDHLAQGLHDVAGAGQQVAEDGQDQEGLGEVLAVGDVALLPRIAQALRGRLFGLFAHGPAP